MTISEQIKVLCIRSNISVAELARRMGTTPQNFNSKMKRESFTISDLEYLAEAVGCSFEPILSFQMAKRFDRRALWIYCVSEITPRTGM